MANTSPPKILGLAAALALLSGGASVLTPPAEASVFRPLETGAIYASSVATMAHLSCRTW